MKRNIVYCSINILLFEMFVFLYFFEINDIFFNFCRLILGVFFWYQFVNRVEKEIIIISIFIGLNIIKDFIREKIKEESYFFDLVLFYFMLYRIKKKQDDKMDIVKIIQVKQYI